ncbi:MAG: hypothetical protein CBC82_05545 [Cellvibrionales bacterium TMED122]|nr:hypothetical protein [Halieaceae bacterium]OUV61908.1 MAG: hypothetical protein CBC82_05545 [Cellvibrionales bacterium TMED122]|tara:strand:- start:961 stop:1182 length:222 start_codon:yes stop_codon:yes gene_type:complete
MSHVRPGRYRHYKGGEYTVIGVARHSETEELLVIYRPEYGERELWVRPQTMFSESVETQKGREPRFALIETEE